jgi:Ca-activated chloride channel family protein
VVEIEDVQSGPTTDLPSRPSDEATERISNEPGELAARAAGVDTDREIVNRAASIPRGRRSPLIAGAPTTAPRMEESRSSVTVGSSMRAYTASQAGGKITAGARSSISAQAYGHIARLPRIPWNTEQYDHTDETGFRDAARRPLSTFSIDVDTASYSNVRRILNDGTLPTPGAVRIEELINYFDYDYPEPQDGRPFSVTTELASAPWNPRHRLLLVGLRGERLQTDRVAPRNLVFLLDVSGSMNSPDKLPLVKDGLRKLARELRGEDHVSIVVYAGASGVVLEPTSGRDAELIDRALDRLHAGGSTNGADGIRLAYQTARTHFDPNAINRVILATDGDFNVGTTSRDELVRLIESERESGVYLTVLGVGSGNLKDATMEQLADHGNGNYAYLDTPAEARKVLIEEAGSTLVTIAKDVKIQIEFNPAAVAGYRLIGYENRRLADRDFNDDTKDAGEIGAGHTVTALYEIVPVGEALPAAELDPLRYGSSPASRREGQRKRAAVPKADDDALANELATVKLRYKSADAGRAATSSELITTTIGLAHRDIDDASSDLRFAASVAVFGMSLVDSEHRAEATLAMAGRLGRGALGADPHAYRAEFLRLVAIAEGLAPRASLQ